MKPTLLSKNITETLTIISLFANFRVFSVKKVAMQCQPLDDDDDGDDDNGEEQRRVVLFQ